MVVLQLQSINGLLFPCPNKNPVTQRRARAQISLCLQTQTLPSKTQRIMETLPVSSEVGGAGGAYSYSALKRLDQVWSKICNSKTVVEEPKEVVSNFPGLLRNSDLAEKVVDTFDVLICGGTLGIFIATALCAKGLRVGVVERNVLQGNRCGFEGKGDIWVEDILNLGVSPVKLIEIVKNRFISLGGVILEGYSMSTISIYEDAAVLQLSEGKILSSRLVIDAMGNFSPVVKQIRSGRKPDGVCLVVGSCARGFENNSDSDVIYSSSSIKKVGASAAQLFWEAFPAGSGPTDRTTYMFTYVDPQPQSPKLEELLEEYWKLMPIYQGVSLDELEIQRVLYGIFPTYRDSPLPAAFDRVLQFGDASGIQSPVSFGGFGSLTRHLKRLSTGIYEAINGDFLDAHNLSLLNPYMPNLSSSWLFQRAMSAKEPSNVSPDFINELLYANFQSMQSRLPTCVCFLSLSSLSPPEPHRLHVTQIVVHVYGLKVRHTCGGVLRYKSHMGKWDLACGFIRVWATPSIANWFWIGTPDYFITWEGIITLLSSLFITLFGMIFQFDMFLKNNFAVIFLIFFLFQLSMIGFAFMLSAFISKSSSSTTVGFSIFIVGSVTQIVTTAGFPYSNKISKIYRIIWSLFPPNLLAKSLEILSSATSPPHDTGIKWSGITKCPPTETDCVITISDIFKWLVATFFLWFTLAIYFDNIIPNVAGVRKSVFYFLNPGYWLGKGGKVKEGDICSCMGSVPEQELLTPDDEDVLEEENIVKQQKSEGVVDPNIAVQIYGLSKSYPGTTKFHCCRCKSTSSYHALKGLWVNFPKNQLFCLLGPNGAGKTTTINCLTGITPVTGGDALIYGNSVRSSVGMAKIRQIIGVCPQFDILWDALSGQEHLHLFAGIKGLSPASIKLVAQKSLVEVRLTEAAKMRAGSYSGGMKRRLSVAIALIGDPKLVILDEPTTGMDPITRRHVWDIIENAKKGRAIVLTTHSMEEADILSDRIGIMAKGRLRCIGTSIRLKSRFGTGFVANVSFSGSTNVQSPPPGHPLTTLHHEAVKQFFRHHLDVLPKEESNAYLTFVIPHDRETLLTKFFKELQDRESEFDISDIQLGLTTLEEVFLNIARQAELETATAEGRLATLTLTSGALIKIPVGARFIGIPGTESTENPRGAMVEVYWVQDDSGALCISGHSPETPIPPNVDPMPSPTSRRSQLPVHGVVIHPDQVSNATSR